MPREVTDGEGVAWACVQAYGGLTEGSENEEAARVEGEADLFQVVCTPSGGAQTVRLELEGGWEKSLSDDELLRRIGSARRGEAARDEGLGQGLAAGDADDLAADVG